MAEKPNPEARAAPLRDALRQARIESAERSAVVVELRDAEIARLELMNEMLDPIFADVPADADFFDRGISRGEPPRLWIDMVAHIVMGRDKRTYRFLQLTRHGPKVLAESVSIEEIAKVVTAYIAHRIVERERALAADDGASPQFRGRARRRWPWRATGFLVLGIVIGVAAVFAAAWIAALRQ